MEFEQYVVARRSRLVEHAVSLGADQDAADALVDRLLQEQRHTIERADDPDPEVREALEDLVEGRRPRRRSSPLAIAAVCLVVAAVVGGVVLRVVTLDPPEVPRVPSTFTLDVARAAPVLTAAGYEVATREIDLCETSGQVVRTEPPPGTEAEEGSTVTLVTARTPGLSCPPGADFRATVWAVLRWVGGLDEAPDLVERPTVIVIDEDGTATEQLDREQLVRAVRDGGLLAPLREVVTAVAPTDTGFPELRVRNAVLEPPCGATPPPGYDGLLTVRFDLDSTTGATDPCPLTGYLMSSGDRLDTIVLVVPTN